MEKYPQILNVDCNIAQALINYNTSLPRQSDVAGTAVKDLIREGKVKHFGLSEAGVQTIRVKYRGPIRL